jgi:hypothetical protein
MRRLSTLESLGATCAAALREAQIQAVVAECAAYFYNNPYRRWFDPLDRVLRNGLGASYYDGSACHLDLVQWATSPTWGKLAPCVRQSLLDESLPYLRDQLRLSNLRFVLINGREVLDQVMSVGLVKLEPCGKLSLNERLSCSLYSGVGDGARFLGWSTNLQSSFGVSREFRDRLARWLADTANRPAAGVWNGVRSMSEFEKAFDTSGFVVKGTVVANKAELLQLLQAWLEASDATKISDAEHARTPWIFMQLDRGRRAELNADTKRSAIEEYVKNARVRGADLPWSVIPNRRSGDWNKLVFRSDREKTPGWYCYLRPGAVGPEEL